MPDFYGPLQLPVLAPGPDDTVADPLLDTLLSFFESILNANAGRAWARVSGYQPGGNGRVVVSKFTWNPEEEDGTVFNSRDLPALFMWRETIDGSAWLAADYYVRPSKIILLWVPPLTIQFDRARWRPFINAIASIIDGITDPDGRDPSFMIPNDDDPAASYLGSLLWKLTPNLFSFDVGRSKPATVKLKIDSGEKPHYPCVRMEIDVRERNTVGEPPDDYFPLGGLEATLTDLGDGPEPAPITYGIVEGFALTGQLGTPLSVLAAIEPGVR